MPPRTVADLPPEITHNTLDWRTRAGKQFLQYLTGDDSQQFDIIREKIALLNWETVKLAQDTAAAIKRGEKKPGELSQLMLAAGVGFDKLYSKRPASVQPLSFPKPLLEMVKKGLELANKKPAGQKTAQNIELAEQSHTLVRCATVEIEQPEVCDLPEEQPATIDGEPPG